MTNTFDREFACFLGLCATGVLCVTAYWVMDRWLQHTETKEAMKAGYEQKWDGRTMIWVKGEDQ